MNHYAKLLALAVLTAPSAALAAGPADLARASGVQGGLVVHLGCGEDTPDLLLNEKYLVHGLDADPAKVDAARRAIHMAGVYGKVSAAAFDGKRLPYTDNLVNLIVAPAGSKVAREEILRVLVPGGVAMLGDEKLVKPWPEDIDQWTHFLHGPDNNAVAADRRAGVPRSLQWVSEPKWGRSHEELASFSAAVSANGRLFFIVDEAPLASVRYAGQWRLVARDAFNGTLLWKRKIPVWMDHLRHFRSGPAHLPRRLVADGDAVYVTLGLAGAVAALDAATGETIRQYPGTERTEEILLSNGVLYLVLGSSELDRRGGGLHERGEPAPAKFRRVMAVDAATGRQKWMRDFTKLNILPLSLTVRNGRVFFQTAVSVTALDAATGGDLWQTPRKSLARRMGFSAPTMVAAEGVVLLADRTPGDDKNESLAPSAGGIQWGVHGWNEKGFSRVGSSTLTAYDAADGKQLWSVDCKENYNAPVDVFVIDGVAWVGTKFAGLDLRTGKPVKKMDASAPRVGMPHHRCYRNKASERFIFTGKSGIEVLSLEAGKWHSNNSWIRGTCQYGVMPANGLVYAPPNACACFLTVKVAGLYAAAPRRYGGKLPLPDQPVLEKGPAYGKDLEGGKASSAGDWPMYRSDAARSGAATCAAPKSLRTKWTAEIGGKLTQPVSAGGRVFVASSDAHTVYALDGASGKELWRFTAGGRIDSAPTVYGDSVIFGSADGWVYRVSAADGKLAWRFRAAPDERLVCAYGQLESSWPVHGSVLVQNGELYVTAGRNTYADGGIVLYRIDPATGRQFSRTVVCHIDPETDRQTVPEARFNMEGAGTDILTGDGENVYLKYFGFDRQGQRTQETNPHLFAITGLLGEEWFVRSYWIVGEGMPGAGWGGWANAASKFPSGRILCFTDDTVYGYGREKVAGGAVGHRADQYHLFAMPRRARKQGPLEDPAPRRGKESKSKAKAKGRARKPAGPAKPAPTWQDKSSILVRAMVLCGESIAIAGPPDLGRKASGLLAFDNEPEALAGFEGKRGVVLRLVGAAEGKKLAETKLPATPVFDGMSAAGGRLLISLKAGTVVCVGQ